MITSKKGTLRDSVTKNLYATEHSITGRSESDKETGSIRRHDIDGGITATGGPIGEVLHNIRGPMGEVLRNKRAAQPFLNDPSSTLSQDKKAQIVKADHLGIICGYQMGNF